MAGFGPTLEVLLDDGRATTAVGDRGLRTVETP